MKIVNREIVPNISSWIKARPLKTRDLRIISLSIGNLSGLIDVSSIIDTVWDVDILP